MSSFQKFLNLLKNPKIWFVILYLLFTIVLVIGSIVVLLLDIGEFWCYIVYALTAGALVYLVYVLINLVPRIRAYFLKAALKRKLSRDYVRSFGFKSLVSVTYSLIINIIYAIFQVVLAFLSWSVWYGALATYYTVLCLIRGGILIKHAKRQSIDDKEKYRLNQIKSYRNCGIYLSLLTLALSAAIVQMVIYNQGFKYAGGMIYVMLLYASYKLIKSIVNIARARRNDDYTTKSIRIVGFADALVSILALQTAMFQAFSQDFVPYIPNSITGGVVVLIIIILGTYMFANGQKQIKKLKEK